MASLWVSDHVVFPYDVVRAIRAAGSPSSGEALPRARHACSRPRRCAHHARLGASVFVLGHRHPVLMAKMLSTIDVLSNGRLICGVGVGWWKQEIEILGAPFHARGRQADEMLRVFKELWTSDQPRFDGEFYRFGDIGFAPKPVQKPHPPIWVGGDSAGAFRRAVAFGDGWHASGKTPAEMRDRIARLRGRRRGRAPVGVAHNLAAVRARRRPGAAGRQADRRPLRRVQAARPRAPDGRLPARRPRADARAARLGRHQGAPGRGRRLRKGSYHRYGHAAHERSAVHRSRPRRA